MEKIINWFLTSNRWLHILGCFILSLVFGWQAGVGAMFATEVKDVQYAKSITAWDWVDVLCNGIGTVLGGLCHFLILR
jgi:hypothetical protein